LPRHLKILLWVFFGLDEINARASPAARVAMSIDPPEAGREEKSRDQRSFRSRRLKYEGEQIFLEVDPGLRGARLLLRAFLRFGERLDSGTIQRRAIRCELRTVAGTIPALFEGIPMHDATGMCA
jgi:hypothetical protein